MRNTKALYGEEGRAALKRGIDQVFNAVAPTLGAKGRNAVYKRYGAPVVTNDGVSIAREILPEDPYERMGAEMIKQAGESTNDEAGDGTTSTTVFAHAMIEEGKKEVLNGENPMVIKTSLENELEKVVIVLKDISVPVTDILNVARISVEDEKIATLVSDVITRVGPRGSIIVEEGHGNDTEVENVKGYWYDRGYVSPYMVTNEKGEAILQECPVLVTDRYMNLNKDLVGVLQEMLKMGKTMLLVIADNVEGELLQTLIANKIQGRFTVIAVRRPSSIEELEDIATVTGAVAVTKDKGIEEITVEHLGMAKNVIVKKDKTIIVGHDSEEVTARIAEVEELISQQTEPYGVMETLKVRLARLSDGLAVIRVGARTDAERGYIKLKIDDAIGACRAALEEGIVAGGGTTARNLSDVPDMGTPGGRILKYALMQPYLQILKNAGMITESASIDTSKDYNVLTGEVIENMIDAGIVDPAKVVRVAIENAVSMAKTFLTTEVIIGDLPEEKPVK